LADFFSLQKLQFFKGLYYDFAKKIIWKKWGLRRMAGTRGRCPPPQKKKIYIETCG
jgi:hypothetical protein